MLKNNWDKEKQEGTGDFLMKEEVGNLIELAKETEEIITFRGKYKIPKIELDYFLKQNYQKAIQKALEIIEKCKIHTAGNLILIEKKELTEKLNQEKEK